MSIATARLKKGFKEGFKRHTTPVVDPNLSQNNKQRADCEMNSPLLFKLLADYLPENYYQILDVMPASNGIIDFFSAFHSKLYLPSCHDGLQSICLEELDTEHKLNRALIRQLGFKKQDKVSLDLLLLWDLPNYLDGKVLRAIIEYLLPHCSDDAILHIYIHTREQMPAKPGTYTIETNSKVFATRNSHETIQSPMYYKESLQKALSPFLVQRGILLSNGVQEYLLKRS